MAGVTGPEFRRIKHRHVVGEVEVNFPLPQLLTPDEVAQYLGISSYTVRQRLNSGEIPGRKHGARWLIRVLDLAAYVEPNNLG